MAFSHTWTQHLRTKSREAVWEKEADPFDELIVSWNAERPTTGRFLFSLSARSSLWSEWLPYASWGADGQKTFQTRGLFVKSYQDIFELSEGRLADAFRIKVEAQAGASLARFRALHATTTRRALFKQPPLEEHDSLSLTLPSPRSQLRLSHPRAKDLCSPTSTSMALDALQPKKQIDPIAFANRVHDSGFDIYGTWIFSVAEGFTHLGGNWICRVERLESFAALYSHLKRGHPVVVSIQGPLQGSPRPFEGGHLIVIRGWDAKERRVLCADPAFGSDLETLSSYAAEEFLAAWAKRMNLSYVFFVL